MTVSHRAGFPDGSRPWGYHGMDMSSMVLDATSCLVLVAEVETGVVVDMNTPAEQMTGFGREQVIGLRMWDLASPDQRGMVERAFIEAREGAFPLAYETTVNLRSGLPRRIVWSSTFLTNEAGLRTHMVITGMDMSTAEDSGGLFGHLILAANSTALISTDRKGHVTYCSTGAERMLGRNGPAMVGRLLPLELFDQSEFAARADELEIPADLALLAVPDVRVERRGGPDLDLGHLDRRREGAAARRGPARHDDSAVQTRDWTIVREDGTRLIASVAISLVKDARGRHVGYVGVAHDVTERGRATQLLAAALEKDGKAIERLHELDRAKSDFVATVSHELRTPTASICGYTELLQDGLAGDLTGPQLEMVDAVGRNSERLIALADDLLTLVGMDEGDLTYDLVEVDLGRVVQSARDALQPLLRGRALDTVVDVSEAQVMVLGDARHLERVLFNLISNAVKFTEDGGQIACRLGTEGEEAVLRVSDTGIGIPSQEQGGLFTRFFRSSTAQARAIQGTGLGLSIVASIVDRHGGTISVESEHLQGTTFTVRLPLSGTSTTASTR